MDPGAVAETLGRVLPATVVPLDPVRRVYRVVDHHGPCHVDLAPLRGGDIAADARLRDFTINALAVPLTGLDLDARGVTVLDHVGGGV